MNATEIENKLKELHYRRHFHTYLKWKGIESPYETSMYEGYEDFLSKKTLPEIESVKNEKARKKLKHAFIDHYIMRLLIPHENDAHTWMKGAKAVIGDEKVLMNNIIPWCQKKSTYETRKLMEKETSALCKFLKKFLLNYWVVLKEALDDLGYKDYIDYCGRKKETDYGAYYETCLSFLKDTDELYYEVMGEWCKRRFNRDVGELSRFDAMNLLGFTEFDPLYPDKSLNDLLSFFQSWGMDVNHLPGLYPDIEADPGKNSQAMCFPMRLPEEVRIVMRPEGGWVDLETLWHEMGHGLFAVHTPGDLPVYEKELATSHSLSEAFAFMIQHITLSRKFLVRFMGVSEKDACMLHYYKTVKDFALFRRYAGKMVVEYEMFKEGDMDNGERYAAVMDKAYGFYHQPESALFDLTPEFYCLDYLLGWMGESMLKNHLEKEAGEDWMFQNKTGEILKNWWQNGNREHIRDFVHHRFGKTLSYKPLVDQWRAVFNSGF